MRTDRKNDQLRNVTIEIDINKYAEGSCLISMGDTKVLCAASVEEKVPLWMRGRGSGWVTAEYGMLPRSCDVRQAREKKSGRTYEIQRLVGRSLRSVVDLKTLGENTIWIDCDVLQGDGGTRTASVTGGFVAMMLAMKRMRDKALVKNIPVSCYLAAVSVGIVNGTPVLDLDYEEDSSAEVDMNVVMTGNAEFIEVQGTAEGRTFSRQQMDSMLSLAEKGIKELIARQREILELQGLHL